MTIAATEGTEVLHNSYSILEPLSLPNTSPHSQDLLLIMYRDLKPIKMLSPGDREKHRILLTKLNNLKSWEPHFT